MQLTSKRSKGRRGKAYYNKGRQLDQNALMEAKALLENSFPLKKDMLIEYLHLFNDKYKGLHAKHLRALAELTKLSMSEIYEVASFYAHFDIIDADDSLNRQISVKVCDSITCFMHKADDLLNDIKKKHPNIKIENAPCMGRCNFAPVVEVNHNHILNSTYNKVLEAIEKRDFTYKNDPHIPLDEYIQSGGYDLLKRLQKGEVDFEKFINIFSIPLLFTNFS